MQYPFNLASWKSPTSRYQGHLHCNLTKRVCTSSRRCRVAISSYLHNTSVLMKQTQAPNGTVSTFIQVNNSTDGFQKPEGTERPSYSC